MSIVFWDFYEFLSDILREKFPNTEHIIVASGDYVQDTVIELRQNNIRYRYSPWELYSSGTDYEHTVEELLNTWKTILGED